MPKICQINSFPFSCQILFHFFTPQFIEMKTNKTIESLTSFKPKSRVLFFLQVQVQAASEREERLNQYTSASKQPTKKKPSSKWLQKKTLQSECFTVCFWFSSSTTRCCCCCCLNGSNSRWPFTTHRQPHFVFESTTVSSCAMFD